MRQPRPGQNVIVKWLDSGHYQEGDPKDPRVGVLAICETHGMVLSCSEETSLRLGKLDSTTLKLALNYSGPDDKQMDVFSIWWPSVIAIRIWKS